MNMKALIDVFRMKEISALTRIRIIKKLGKAINDDIGMNITGELVDELVTLLSTSSNHPQLGDKDNSMNPTQQINELLDRIF